MNQRTNGGLYQFLLLAFSILFSMGLFLAAYQYDNKYTLHSPQPIGGMLYFNPDTDSLTHLINGWQFYKGRLLAPQDFTGEPPLPDGYISIGQYSGMEAGHTDASPHGSITYGLTLVLPDTPASYTLELPEIYSAYRLYIDDRLMASQGIPEKAQYAPEIHSSSVTFEAAGNTRVLLAVSDWSWLYSGLVYPPAFGTTAAVKTLLDQKLAWGFSITVLALLLAAFQMVLAAVQKSRRTLYAALICIAFAVSVCSPSVHRLVVTGVMPFYNLELFCRYAVYGIAVLLANHLYVRHTRGRVAVSATAVIFPLAALGISLASPALNLESMLMLSHSAEIYKIFCALWIVFTAFLAGRKAPLWSSQSILLAGACVFASSLAADRLLPSFEPIRFGWYSEIAGLIFVLLISLIMLQDALRLYKERILLVQQKEQLQIQVGLQKSHYMGLADQMEEIRILRHDVHHHYNQLSLLLNNDDYEGASHYLNQINNTALRTVPLSFCKNYMTDVLLRYYYAKAQEASIPFTIRAELPSQIGVPDEDLSIILGNMLENALEANLRIPESKRFMSLSIKLHSGSLMVKATNAFHGKLEKQNGKYCSAKENGRTGIGISSIQAITEKYDGTVWIDTDESTEGYVFTIRILLITSVT